MCETNKYHFFRLAFLHTPCVPSLFHSLGIFHPVFLQKDAEDERVFTLKNLRHQHEESDNKNFRDWKSRHRAKLSQDMYTIKICF